MQVEREREEGTERGEERERERDCKNSNWL